MDTSFRLSALKPSVPGPKWPRVKHRDSHLFSQPPTEAATLNQQRCIYTKCTCCISALCHAHSYSAPSTCGLKYSHSANLFQSASADTDRIAD